MKKLLFFLLLTQLSSSYIQLFDVIPIKFIPSTNFFCTDLDSEDFYIYVECSKNMKIPNGIYVPKVWNFSYISENPKEKNKTLDIQCDLYGDEDSHHMICKLTKKFSLFNLKGPFKRPLIWEKKDFYFTYEGEVYQSRVDNNNYGYIYRYLGHTKEKKMLSIPIKDGKNSFNYTFDKPPYFLSYEFKENLYDYYSPVMVSNISTEIPCTIINEHNVNCYFTKEMFPSSKDAVCVDNVFLKNPCGLYDETNFYMITTDGYVPQEKKVDKSNIFSNLFKKLFKKGY